MSKIDKRIQPKNISPKKPLQTGKTSSNKNYPALILLLLITIVAYFPVLKAGFVDWDDSDYVINNLLIKDFSRLGELIITPVQGNIHPLTMISLAINYSISGMEPWSYHLFNLLLHLANTFVVFEFCRRLSNGNSIIPITTASLFALHPMHVESVAWIAERKDVLYCLFFLLGLISYLKYVDSKSRKSYLLCITWFLLSLFSKPAAVIFPVALFTIDLFKKRKINFSLLKEKIPFLAFAIAIGYYTMYIQVLEGSVNQEFNYFKYEKIFFGFYGFMMYLYKLIWPLSLATFYPYPPVNHALPILYYISPLFFIATVILCIKTFKKFPAITFGFSFYFINLLLVLQFILVGSAIISDRYTYLPYVGIFYVVGWLLDKWQKHSLIKAAPYMGVVCILLSVLTYNQAATWKSSETLWDQAIKAYPSSNAYLNRSVIYRKAGQNVKAVELLNEAVKLNVNDPFVFLARGNANFDLGNIDASHADFNSAIQLNPEFLDALNSRGAMYGSKRMNDSALADLNKAISLNPDYTMAYKNRALVFTNMKKFDAAIIDFNKYLEHEPRNANIINSVGVCYQSLRQFETSITFFDKAIAIDQRPVFFLNRSYSWNGLGKLKEARDDAVIAKQGGEVIPEEYAKYYGL